MRRRLTSLFLRRPKTATTGTDVAIGEVITYRLRAVVDEGTTTLSIVDQLPTVAGGAVLQILSGSVVSVGGSITTAWQARLC